MLAPCDSARAEDTYTHGDSVSEPVVNFSLFPYFRHLDVVVVQVFN